MIYLALAAKYVTILCLLLQTHKHMGTYGQIQETFLHAGPLGQVALTFSILTDDPIALHKGCASSHALAHLSVQKNQSFLCLYTQPIRLWGSWSFHHWCIIMKYKIKYPL